MKAKNKYWVVNDPDGHACAYHRGTAREGVRMLRAVQHYVYAEGYTAQFTLSEISKAEYDTLCAEPGGGILVCPRDQQMEA
jgi:hypothetical protein